MLCSAALAVSPPPPPCRPQHCLALTAATCACLPGRCRSVLGTLTAFPEVLPPTSARTSTSTNSGARSKARHVEAVGDGCDVGEVLLVFAKLFKDIGQVNNDVSGPRPRHRLPHRPLLS